MLTLLFHGATQTVTGSMIEVGWEGRRILLECGLVQGRVKATFARNRRFPFEASGVDAVVVSHAHLDHSGNLPSLVKQGFRGPVYATVATRDLCDMMLRDSARLLARETARMNRRRAKNGKRPFERLYNERDVEDTMALFQTVEYGQSVPLAPGLALTLHDAGHVLGSATLCLDYAREGRPRRLLFTGDVGQGATPLLCDPVPVADVDVLITESTYGNRRHPSKDNVTALLREHLAHAARHKSKIVIPAFSVGRTQQLLYYFNEVFKDRAVQGIPVIVDSPMSLVATQAHYTHRRYLHQDIQTRMASGDNPFMFSQLFFTSGVADSEMLNAYRESMVIISASGMCEGGRILRHLGNTVTDPSNIVLMVEFQAKNTLGRRIAEGQGTVHILGRKHALRAKVCAIHALSGHADANGLRAFFQQLGDHIQTAFCVHGEAPQCRATATLLSRLGIPNVHVPVSGQPFEDV